MKINKRFLIYATSFMLTISTLIGCNEQDVTSSELGSNFVSLESIKRVALDAGATETFDFNVYASAEHSSDRTYNLVVNTDDSTLDPMYYAVPVSVTIPANSKIGTFQISVTGTDLGTGKTLILGLESVAGTDMGGDLTINVKELCNQNLIALDLIFDDYASETFWQLYDADFNLIASTVAGNYSNGTETASEEFCLASGDYTFVIFDDFGDGMYDGTNTGSYNLVFLSPTTSLSLASGEGNFGSNVMHPFTIE